MFLALTKELGLSEKDTGVPFVYDTVSGKHAVGVGPALELFKSRLNTSIETGTGTQTSQETNSNTGEVTSETEITQETSTGDISDQTSSSN